MKVQQSERNLTLREYGEWWRLSREVGWALALKLYFELLDTALNAAVTDKVIPDTPRGTG